MVRVFRNFLRSDSGAVTVDWVVPTASVVFMAAIPFYQIRDSSGSMEEATASALAAEQTSLFPE